MKEKTVNVLRICRIGVLAPLVMFGCTPSTSTKMTYSPQARDPKVAMPSPITFALCADGLPEEGMWKCDPILTDFNRDGLVDLAAIPRLGKGPKAWLGNGRGKWTESAQGLDPKATSCGGGMTSHDVNRDGHLDLVVADHCQGVYVYLGNGAGQWRMVTDALYPEELGKDSEVRGAEDLDVGDVNNDGFADIVASASDTGGIMVYFGDGTGKNWQYQKSTELPTTGWANRVVLHDVNRDGSLDIAASFGSGPRVWLNNGRGEWNPSSTGLPSPLMQGLFQGIALGDVNGDGRVDIAAANWIDGPEVFLQEEGGSWRSTPTVFPDMYGGAYGIALGDLDLDGALDMAVSGRLTTEVGYVYGLFVLKGDGRGNWEYLHGTGVPETGLSTAWGITIGDVNGDTVPDVVYNTGGIVGTDVELRTEPIMPVRVQVWCTQLENATQSALASTGVLR
jgi:hypothetical protein